MELTASSPESVAHAFLRAINRQDVDALVALMSPAHRLVDSLGNVVEDREKLREGWAAYFRMVPDYAVAIEETYPSGPVVVMLGVAQGTFTRNGTVSRQPAICPDRSIRQSAKSAFDAANLPRDCVTADWFSITNSEVFSSRSIPRMSCALFR